MEAAPVIAFVGHKRSGKTTVMEGVIAELASRGVRVACAKHHSHATPVDTDGKDSARHARAGAVVAMVSSPIELATFRAMAAEATLDELAVAAAPYADILLAEGFGDAASLRIEVFAGDAADREGSPRFAPGELAAIVTDRPLDSGYQRVFAPSDIAALSGFVVGLARGSTDGD